MVDAGPNLAHIHATRTHAIAPPESRRTRWGCISVLQAPTCRILANMQGTHAKVPPWTWWSMGADGMHVGSASTSFTHTCANTQSTHAQVPPKWGPGRRLALWRCISVLQPPNAQKTKGTHAKVPPKTRSSGRWARWECILILQAPTSRIYAQTHRARTKKYHLELDLGVDECCGDAFRYCGRRFHAYTLGHACKSTT